MSYQIDSPLYIQENVDCCSITAIALTSSPLHSEFTFFVKVLIGHTSVKRELTIVAETKSYSRNVILIFFMRFNFNRVSSGSYTKTRFEPIRGHSKELLFKLKIFCIKL